MEDSRLAWMRDRTLAFLNEKDQMLFSELLNRDEGKVRQTLIAFLDADLSNMDSKKQKVVYFYKTFYDKIIEEEIVVAEPAVFHEAPKEDTPPPVLVKKKGKKKLKSDSKKKKENVKEAEGEVDAVADDGDGAEVDLLEGTEGMQTGDENEAEAESAVAEKTVKKRKKTAERVKKEKGKVSPRTAVEASPPPSEEPLLVYNTKVVEKVVQAAELHLMVDDLEGSSTQQNMILIYFLRQQLGPVPKCDHFHHACSILPNHFLIGCVRGNYLNSVYCLVKNIFSPVIEKQFRDPDTALSQFEKLSRNNAQIQDDDDDDEQDTTVFPQFMPPSFYRRFSVQVLLNQEKVKMVDEKHDFIKLSSAKSELINDFKQLSDIIESTLGHLREAITLEMPDINLKYVTPDSLENDTPVLNQAIATWVKHATNTMTGSASDRVVVDSPLEEICFWQNRLSTLSLLQDQLDKSAVLQIIDYAKKAQLEICETFSSKKLVLKQKVYEARENVKCLSTILRYLKIVTNCNSFPKISSILPLLVEGLRMIWNLSRYFNSDDTMIPLMNKVSSVLCKKVSLMLKSETIFKEHLHIVLLTTKNAQEMLINWRKCYLETRLKIEESGGGNRWEFDQKKLFSETEYIALVCADLHNIASVVDQFLQVFGPDLKAIIKDPSQVDSVVKRVENLVLGIEMTDFDIFKPSCRDNWHAVVETFYKDVAILERDAKFFIDQAFFMIKSSEDALEALIKFKNVETRPVIKSNLSTKFDVVLEKLVRHVNNVQDLFNRTKKNPPLLRYQPPESGAIFWERMLFLTMKKTILRFQEVEDCRGSPFRKEAFESYFTLAQQMKEYENKKFENWRVNAVENCLKVLQKSLLKIEHSSNQTNNASEKFPHSKITAPIESVSKSTFRAASRRFSTTPTISSLSHKKSGVTSLAFTGSITSSHIPSELVLSELNVKLEINFSDEIFKVIAEAELMEYLGFIVPLAIRNISLQKERLHLDLTSVQNMIAEYNEMLSQLSPELLQFTRDFVLDVQKHILPGYSRLNWNSLGITDYVKNCNLAIKQLSTVMQQTARVEKELNSRISLMENFDFFLFSNDDKQDILPNCKSYFEKIYENRTEAVKQMIEIYKSIGPLLIKLESLIHHTNSGMSPKMKLLYQFWGNKINKTFVSLLMRNLSNFEKALNGEKRLFDVEVELRRPHVVLQPIPEDLHNLIIKSAVDCVEVFKLFPKWRPNTCIPSEEVQSDKSCILSFYENMKGDANDVLSKMQTSAINLAVDCEKKLWSWKKYSMLWTRSLDAKCNAFASRNPSLSDYDEKLTFYSMVAAEVTEMFPYENVSSIRLNFKPMIKAVQELCQRWKQELAERLLFSTKIEMDEFQAVITDLSCNLTRKIETLDDFKEVLKTISTIQKTTVASEIKYEEFEEVYHVLSVHKIEVNVTDDRLSKDSKLKWQQLYVASLCRSHELQPTKEKFSAISQQETVEFLKILEEFFESYKSSGPGAFEHDISACLVVMKSYRKIFAEHEIKRQELLASETLFGLPAADYSNYMNIKLEFQNLELLFEIYEQVLNFRETTSHYLWAGVNINVLIETLEEFLKQFRSLKNNIKTSIVGLAVEKNLKEHRISLNLMSDLKSDSLVERHWQMLMNKTNVHFNLEADRFTLEKLYSMNLFQYPGIVEEIVHSAGKEKAIEISVKELFDNWLHFPISILPHFFRNEQRSFVLTNSDEIVENLEHDAIALQIMSASQYIGPFLKVVGRLEKTLSLYGDILDAWLEVQRKWIYLESIFIGSDIKNQLPEESRKFDAIDKIIRRILTEAAKRPILRDFCEVPGKLNEVQMLNLSLEECKKSLSFYLELKQNSFPRFYFLSDDELLSALGNPDPATVQWHLIKMFDNVGSFMLSTDSGNSYVIKGLISYESDVLIFQHEVVADGKIEDWMTLIVNEMRASNKLFTKKAVYDYGRLQKPRADLMMDYPGMVVFAANQVWWTAEVEESFLKISKGELNAMKKYLEFQNKQVAEEVVKVLGNLMSNERSKLNALIIIDLHARDVVEKLLKDSIINPRSFEWESQLRFYWKREPDNLFLEQCTGIFEYGYEYLGVSGRLTITPLTERIYLTITQALSLHLGAAPLGPAGTGKTETVKDLAKTIGLLCLVTNCSDLMDFHAFEKILSGLCQCGAWGCFDEFNRIDISVLSVISSQLNSIRNALLLKLTRFNMDSREIALDKKVGVFITMNPGYAGRTELPESIKILFRPVVCIVPDLEIICLTMLMSEGFHLAKQLAKKITMLYSLCKEQLSKQYHYDFGLRAIKSVLVIAGRLKRQYLNKKEDLIVMEALWDMNTSKLVDEDLPIFIGIIKDLFPCSDDIEKSQIQDLSNIEDVFVKNHYELVPNQVKKVCQLRATMISRHSTMLVGPSGGGKTTIFNILFDSYKNLGFNTFKYIMNPKACSIEKLYGTVNINTKDWTDGLLSLIYRQVNILNSSKDLHFIVFDGDVDPLWIENMNSVMDDNKLLTLSNGERIRLQPHCKLLFEVGDLKYASPATVSRAGMVYVGLTNQSYCWYWKRWLETDEPQNKDILTKLFEKYIHSVVRFVIEGWDGVLQGLPLRQVIPHSALNMTIQFCSLLAATLPKKSAFGQDEDESEENAWDLVEAIFVQDIVYSFGGSLSSDERHTFDVFLKRISGMLVVNDSEDKKAEIRFLPGTEKNLYDYQVNVKTKCWQSWTSEMPLYQYKSDMRFENILVPTVDTCRAEWLINCFKSVQRPVMFIGSTGSSKTSTITNFFNNLPAKLFLTLKINFSSRTKSNVLLGNLLSGVSKRTKHVYGPTMGSKLLIFIDDLNMPSIDSYGTQQPIAFLKLLFEYNGFYNFDSEHTWINLCDSYFLAAMTTAGGGKSYVDPRFLSKFSIFNMALPNEETMIYIYKTIICGHVHSFLDVVKNIITTLVTATVRLLSDLKIELPATPSKFHYIFSPRDMSRITLGLRQTYSEGYKTEDSFLRVWRNETSRVLCDRLINSEDIMLVKGKIQKIIETEFSDSAETALRDPLLFGDFRNACRRDEQRHYEDLLDYEAVYFLFKEILEEYSELHGTLKMVLFDYVVENLTRIHRVLRLESGHMLIIGQNGCGKKAMAKLAGFAADCETYEISFSTKYNLTSLHEDIRNLYRSVGLANRRTVFIFSDSDILEEEFLEIINNMLSIGVTTSIFTDEERNEIISNLSGEAQKAGVDDSKDGVWNYFSDRCNLNLHIVLAMSPLGDNLRRRCRNFPNLINCTTINWFFPWPEDALLSVANAFLAENPEVPETHRLGVVKHVVHVYSSLPFYSSELYKKYRRNNYVTPKHYLSYIESFIKLLTEKNEFIIAQSNRLRAGLERIANSRMQLFELNQKLVIQQIAVETKTLACDNLLQTITEATDSANRKKLEATKRKQEIEHQERVIKIEKTEAQKILDKALPVLESAKLALHDLDKSDITEIRSFATPPQAVQTVCECVLYLLGVKEISWKSAKAVMSDPNFILMLRELNCDQITLTQQRLCKGHSKNLPPDLSAASSAAHGLMMYVQAVLNYCSVLREIKPKKEKVVQLEQDNISSHMLVSKLSEEITDLNRMLLKLNEQYKEASSDRLNLQNETDVMSKRLMTAETLLSSLASEDERWRKQLTNFENEREPTIGNSIMSAAFLIYLGPFAYEMRMYMLFDDWKCNLLENNIPLSSNFQLQQFLCDDVRLSKWATQGLASDAFSVQNGILSQRGSKFPFFIDPQKQVIQWIRNQDQKVMKYTSFLEPDYLKQLEIAIQTGQTIVFEDIEHFIDPIMENIIEKKYRLVGSNSTVVIGEKTLDVHSEFRLFLISYINNPAINPIMFAKSTVINFSVTPDGLEEQLLSVAIGKEKPDLEETRKSLVKETWNNMTMIKTLEDLLLRELASASSDMLDNEELLSALKGTKDNTLLVTNQLQMAEKTTIEIDIFRHQYRPVAKRGSLLFFVLRDMALVSPMYQFSLSSYLHVFLRSLADAEDASELEQRLENILNKLMLNTYEYGCLGVFETHKLLLSLQIAISVDKSDGKISDKEIDFFSRDNFSLENTELSWLNDVEWGHIKALSNVLPEIFQNLSHDLKSNETEWQCWYDSKCPENEELPSSYSVKLRPFQKVLLLKCFRNDRVIRSVRNYVRASIGHSFVIAPPIDFMFIFEKSTPTMPILLMLSPGSDPIPDLMKLAESCGMAGGKFKQTSLGQGRETIANAMLESAISHGQWLLLQNCHLLLKFMKKLEKLLDNLQSVHPDFRLWLTSDPTLNFPVGLLQRSLKIVSEVPRGIKLNLKSTYLKMGPTILETVPHRLFKPLTFVLAFFHAVLQERKKYNFIGWNVKYDFSDSDFFVSLEILEKYLTKSKQFIPESVPWPSLRYLIGEIVYGGRVIDYYDRRVLATYVNEYFGEFLFDGYQQFHFFGDNETSYTIPASTDYRESLIYIENLPDDENPAVFGLHANAEIDYATRCAKDLWSNMIQMQPMITTIGIASDKEAIVDNSCTEIMSKIPPEFDLKVIRRNFEMNTTPSTVVLLQEVKRFNVLIKWMKKSLILLTKALAGIIEMDDNLDEMSNYIFRNQIPVSWTKLMPKTTKSLGSWVVHFERRTKQYESWSLNGDPIVMWLSGLHVPESYLVSLIQIACRSNGWPLEVGALSTAVSEYTNSDEVERGLEGGCYVEGLFLEGARWDTTLGCLRPPVPKVLIEKLPILKISPIEKHQLQQLNTLRTPVYVTSLRRNAMGDGIAFEVDLNIKEHFSHWVLRGVCLLLNID